MQPLIHFLRLWVWFNHRHLAAHPWRALAVLFGIGLGAAVFTSVRLAVIASLDSFTRSMDAVTGKTEWTIVQPGARVPEKIVAEILKNRSIKTASPLLISYVHLSEISAEPFLLIGLDPILDRPLRNWELENSGPNDTKTWLELVAEPYTLFVTRKLADQHQLQVGETITLEAVGHKHSFTVLGLLKPEGLALADGGAIAVTDISTMQEFTGLHGQVDRIDLALEPAAGNDLQGVRSLLPKGIILAQPTEYKESGKLMIKAYQLNLSVLSFVSLFVGMFLVYSLVSLNATSRRHELAVLCSLGSSSRTLFLLFITEGAFFGFAGWLLAIPLASFLIKYLLTSVSWTISHLFVRVQVERLTIDIREILLSFLITIIVSIVAAYQPARQAMKISPKEAFLMHEFPLTRAQSIQRLALMGFMLILLVWPLCALPAVANIPLPGYLATFFLFCGFSLLSPWCLHLTGSYLPPLLKRVGGQPAYLGSRYMKDAGTRIAVSVGALITAMALFLALVVMVHSFRRTVELWVNQSIQGDLFLQTQMANINSYKDSLPAGVVASLKEMQNRIELLPYRRMFLYRDNIRYVFETIDFEALARHGGLLFLQGNPREIMPNLMRGEGVVVSEVFANQTGLSTGERFRALIEGVQLDLPILGIYRDYRTQGGVVHYSLKQFEKLSGDSSWTGVRVFIPPQEETDGFSPVESRAQIVRRIVQIANQSPGVELTLGRDLRSEILRIFDETFAVTTVLLLIALFVAALGITTTLAVLVLERARELNTLIAVGAAFKQIQLMLFWEALLMVAVGEVLGMGCGFLLSKLLILVINKQSFGWTFLYSVDWGSVLASLPLILATALLAAIPAGRLVLQHSPASLLRER